MEEQLKLVPTHVYSSRLSTRETGKPGDNDRWSAFLDGDEGDYATGRSEEEAVGALILENPDVLGERL